MGGGSGGPWPPGFSYMLQM